ncbi:helix-turn-helix domain-containing protein [uncultured Dokdonia sp.]|uniref:helix-turn-helix domain-containing protein n=1 Tax=uncultured Dokdonia sp. TaxID=575653 RepID=UPI0026072F1A|nr:helix-turn-helix domain-containing protein [uncultured Dokdonia sp.]
MLIGITQGVVMSVLLFRSKNNKRNNPFLALGILAFSWVSTKPLLHTLHLWDTPFFRYFPNGADLAIAPLLYLYLVSLIDAEFRFSRKHIIHFIPFIVLQGYLMFIYFSLVGTSDLVMKDQLANSLYFNPVKDIESHGAALSSVIYILLSFRKFKEYREWLSNTISDSSFPEFKWIKQLLLLCLVVGGFLVFNYSADLLFNLNKVTGLHWTIFSLFGAFSIYYMGVAGYKQPNYELEPQQEIAMTSVKEEKTTIAVAELSERDTQIVKAINDALKKDKVFLNPTLNIQELSRKLSLPQQEISQVINAHFHKKFRDLINEYRVEEVKKMLHSEKMSHMSILGVALECGFNSEATFYRIFKKNTGLSPKEYRRQSA